MENLEGMKGAIAVSILKKGLKSDSTISFVVSPRFSFSLLDLLTRQKAAEDVGKLAAAVFKVCFIAQIPDIRILMKIQKHECYKHRSLLVVSNFLTLQEIESDHYSVTGKPLPSAPTVIGWGLNKGSTKTRELMYPPLSLSSHLRADS